MANNMWDHFHSAAGTATLTHLPATPFPSINLHFEYSAFVQDQQRRASRQLRDVQTPQFEDPPKKSTSVPSTPNLGTESSFTNDQGHRRQRSTLQRLHTYHEGLVKGKRKTEDQQDFTTPRYEIWGGKAVPVAKSVSGSSSFSKGTRAIASISRFTTISVPSDHAVARSIHQRPPLAFPLQTGRTPPSHSDPGSVQRQQDQGFHPDPDHLDGLRRVKSDINNRTALPFHETTPGDGRRDLVTQSMFAHGQYQTGPVEPISPPSSPDLTEQLNYDISPIDDDEDWELPQQYYLRDQESPTPSKQHPQNTNDFSNQEASRSRASSSASVQRPRTNIPAMRRERRKLQDAAAKASRDQKLTGSTQSKAIDQDTRMDFSGAIPDHSHMLGSTTTITANNQQSRRIHSVSPSFGERMRQFGKGKADSMESRPAWNGGSGRQATTEPLRDDLNAAPLKPRAPKGSRASGNGGFEAPHSSSAASAVRKFMPVRGQRHEARDTMPDRHQAVPFGALSSHPQVTNVPSRNDAPPIDGPGASGQAHADYFSQEKTIKRKPPPNTLQPPVSTHAAHPSVSSSVYSTHTEMRSRTESPQLGFVPSSDEGELTGPWVQPPPPAAAAFSSQSTTPSTSSSSSPGPIAEAEDKSNGDSSLPSVMDRRRPLRGKDSPPISSVNDPIVISLKTASYATPKPDPETMTKTMKGSRPSSIMSTSKDLPLSPPEMIESDDRVAVLNAKLMGLAHRRNNINRSIQQMTELMPKDMLLVSTEVQRKREDEKRKVELLREELADIQQKEFDLGLKLHRANKRRERESEFESSGGLWIRRITS